MPGIFDITKANTPPKIAQAIHEWLKTSSFDQFSPEIVYTVLIASIFVIFSILLYYLVRWILLKSVTRIFKNSRNMYDKMLINRGVLNRLTYIAPLLVANYGIEIAFYYYPSVLKILERIVESLFIYVLLIFIIGSIRAMGDIYDKQPYSRNRPIRGYLQGLQLIICIIAFLAIISLLFKLKMTAIFTSLGALAAVLLLIFRDTILNFVAGIQLLTNNMVKPGDWIAMESNDANGTVLEMNLNTVKVENWDKTISTIPTNALVTESFINWKGMEESGGRRIKRYISIDMRTICFCTDDMIEKFMQIDLLRDFLIKRKAELEEANTQSNMESSMVNGYRFTNIGVFRHYLEMYLHDHQDIHDDMTFMVRQLQPTEKGLPLEIYVFCKDQRWEQFEAIQADIFDHILAILPDFKLKAYQYPTDQIFGRGDADA